MSTPAAPLSQRVALIGAGGFLGTVLARHLAPRVEDLHGFGRRRSFADALPPELRWFAGDIADTDALDAALAGCDAVIHLASTSTPATADRDIAADAEANVIASLKLFERCVAAGVGRLLFLSSGGTIYGIPEITPTPESAAALPITAYGVAKLSIEKYLEVYRRQRGLDYRVLRVANVYGPYQTAEKLQGVVAAFLSRALRGEPLEIWGDGQVVRDYVYAGDVAEAVEAALRHRGEKRVFNIGSGGGLSLNEVIAAIEHQLGRHLEKRYRSGRPVDVPVSVLDCALAGTELDWHAHTAFDEGLSLTAAWMTERSAQQ